MRSLDRKNLGYYMILQDKSNHLMLPNSTISYCNFAADVSSL